MSTDDRTETITDRAAIRASDEASERGDFPCCSGARAAGDAVAALDLDAIRLRAEAVPSLVRGPWEYENCGNECCQWIESPKLADGHDPLNSPTALRHIAGMDPDTTLALVAEVRRLTVALDMGGAVWSSMAQEYDALRGMAEASTAWRARAEAAEAQRDVALAKVAAVEARLDRLDKDVQSIASASDYGMGYQEGQSDERAYISRDLRAALATGEGK